VTHPRISALVPCFNHGAFIRETIDSILTQTYPAFEVIVVDDGSSDPHTKKVLKDLAGERITVLTTENRGLPAARNHAARHARGEFFCAVDADDKLAPEWFEKAARVLDAEPNVAFVSHWLETFGDEHWTWQPQNCELAALLARNAVNGAALVRRAAFEAVGGYDESMREGCEDWDFWLRLVEQGYRGEIIPEVLFYYRRRADSMSRVMLEEHAYRRPLEILVRKHEASYRTHLIPVLVAKEAETLHLSGEIRDLERNHLVELEPALQRAREELDAIAGKAARVEAARALEEEREHLSWKAAELEREVRNLRASWSWRLTAPLRKVYARLTGEEG
jgi:glycosyltransferase involved in cell wall biosynthesis